MNAVKIDITSFHAAFFDEAEEHLGTMESGLLELETSPHDAEILGSVFRAAHSIKGGSGTFGFTAIMQFTHGLEALLDGQRSGTITPTAATSQLLLRAVDVLRELVASSRNGTPAPAGLPEVEAALLAAANLGSGGEGTPATKGPGASSQAKTRWTIGFTPQPQLFMTGMDPLLVVRDLCDVGSVVSVAVDASALPDLEALEPETSYFGWTVVLESDCDESALRDVFAFVEDACALSVAKEASASPEAAPPSRAMADVGQAAGAATGASGAQAQTGVTVRVATEKLDRLIDLLGELVICQSMVAAAVNDTTPEGVTRLHEAIAAMDRNTRELQDRVMAVRMVPIGAVFNRFPRVVRDIATATKKSVRLEITGEETELDKGIVEVLVDPLTHLVRNAADHGIEPPEERIAAGKDAEGVVHLRAMHEGGAVVVEVEDDGRGMQTERIKQKAISLGLLSADSHPTDDEIHQLVFAAGFSTAAKVTDVSGRGVGMDVVKRNVEGMGGTVTFRTAAGRGSTLRVRLPLTMAIIEGLSVRVGDQVFVAPLLSIVESFRPRPEQVSTVLGHGEVVSVRGESVRLVRLHQVLGIVPDYTDPCRSLVCVVESGATRAALLVDELLGKAQVVVKSLETHYRKVEGITGATILGDGRVALILDVQAIVQRASSRREREWSE